MEYDFSDRSAIARKKVGPKGVFERIQGRFPREVFESKLLLLSSLGRQNAGLAEVGTVFAYQ